MTGRSEVTMTGDPRRREFRAWVRSHHPDVGGDPAAFAAGLRRWQRGAGAGVGLAGGSGLAGPSGVSRVAGFRTRGGLWRLARWWDRARREQRVR